jgi:cytochrome c
VRKLMTLSISLAALFGMITVAAAEASHTPDQVKAFVQKAADYMRSEGKEKALAAFNDPKGPFVVDGDLYIVAQDAVDGRFTILAHGANKGLVGKPQIDTKDAEGKAFNRDVIAALNKDGDEIWTSYLWVNFATKKIARKKSYFLRVGDVVLAAGMYE